MILQTLHCPARGRRVETGECYRDHMEANAGLARLNPARIRDCYRCATGYRNRRRHAFAEDTFGREQKYLDTAGKGR